MTIRKALISDIDEIVRVYSAAREYMRSHNNPSQWGDSYPPRSIIENDIASGYLYVIEDEGKIHASFAFFEGPDETYKIIERGEWRSTLPYFVMHRMASDGIIHGVGKTALDFCKKISGNIRADTHSDNITMQNLLRKNGFLRCGIISVNGSERIAYQYIKQTMPKT